MNISASPPSLSPAPRRAEPASRRRPPGLTDDSPDQREGETLSLSTGPDARPFPSGGAFRATRAFSASARRAGADAVATGQRLASRLRMDLSVSSASLWAFSDGVDRLTDEEEVLNRYLLLIDTFLEDPEHGDALGRFIGGVQELLNGASEEDIGATLRRIFGGEGDRGTVRLSEAVAGFVARLRVSLSVRGGEAPVEETGEADPLVLDLGGDGIRTSGVDSGVGFDIVGDGRFRQVSFVSGDDAALALDRNGNGIVDDGRELFGDQNGAANGFLELARYDGNGDGQIDAQDAIYEKLRVFQDLNGGGISRPGGLKGLREAGVASVSVRFSGTHERTDGGDRVAQRSFFLRSDGSKGQAVDLLLRYRNDRPADARRMDVRG